MGQTVRAGTEFGVANLFDNGHRSACGMRRQ
jgi:hypothetical protein